MKLKHFSPSTLNMFCADAAMLTLEKIIGVRLPVGTVAHRGTAVEAGVTLGLMEGADDSECIDAALRKFDTISALSGDKRREEHRETIPEMVRSALEELRPYGKPTGTQVLHEWQPDGLGTKIIGYSDYEWDYHGIIIDLKTTEKLPSAIKLGHARQVAHYSSDNIDARLTYCTPKKKATYRLENIREHRNALYQIGLRLEKWLALSDDPMFFVSITAPDLESFYWASPQARQLAYEYWRI